MSNQRISQEQCCPIQRLVVIHTELPQLSGRGYLDENASFEEASEQILYYYDDELKNATGNASHDNLFCPIRYQLPEAVQFVRLCTALLMLPASMDSDQDEDSKDATEFVYLEKSLLVFVTLESSPLIVAVVQVARVDHVVNATNNGERAGCCGSPLAIKSTILQSYQLFQLLRGGGIHYRLLYSKDAPTAEEMSSDVTEDGVYPGMKRLFRLRKRVRKACDQNKNPDIETKVPEQEIQDMQREIEDLESDLPITALRSDLSVHFNDLLGELTLVGNFNSKCVKHCLIDAIPAPVALMSGSHRTLSTTPISPDVEILNRLLGTTQQLVDAENQHWAPGEPFLLGISTFVSGKLISTIYAESDHSGKGKSSFDVPLSTAYLIMQYIASYRYKIMIHHHHGAHSAPASPPRFQHLPLPFESTDGPSGDDHDSVVRSEARQTRLGQFLSPPPLSMLSATDRVHDLQGPYGERIWAPRLYLPQLTCSDTQSSTLMDVRVIVYELKDLCFLLYFTPDGIFSHDITAHSDLTIPASIPPNSDELHKQHIKLETISRQLTDCFEQLSFDRKSEAPDHPEVPDSTDSTPFTTSILEWKEPGQDIVFVDRANNQILLFSDRLTEASVNDQKKLQRSPSRSPTRSFLSRLKGKKSQRTPARERKAAAATDGSTVGLDCRHFLASLLPSDSLYALDDVISEVQERNKDDNVDGDCEMATFTAHGWVYARARTAKELYVLFDSSVYVTVADVQHAASRIRNELLKNTV